MTFEDVLVRLSPALSPRARTLLEPLVRGAEITEEAGDVVLTFPTDPEEDELQQLRLFAPGERWSQGPAELRAWSEVCGGAEMGERGETGQLALHDGSAGTLGTVGQDAWNRKFPFAFSEALCAPIDLNLQAFYVFHPSTGDLYFRDEGTLQRVRDCRDPVEVYLREVHLRLQAFPPTTPLQRAVAAMPARHTWLE
jgi:hypothetical protein